MAYDQNNVFARILRGEIPASKVYEDEYALAFKDLHPKAPIHVLVIPKGAYINFTDFAKNASADERAGFFKAVAFVAETLGVEETGYRLLSNIGRDGGQEVPHFHVHLFAGAKLGAMIGK